MAGNVLILDKMENQPERPLGKRILLVDDERSVRENLCQLLRLDDHIVMEANNGAEALAFFAQHQFDVVLTDSVMPFIEGAELAVRIKQCDPDLPILMITGHDVHAGRNNPVNGVLKKPFGLGELRSALAEVL